MLTYDDIATYCLDTNPALIYLSIGCAQNGNPVSNEQQLPPFIRDWPAAGRILLILVDPALESPPHVAKDLDMPFYDEYEPVNSNGRFDIITVRQPFIWVHDEEKAMLDALYVLSLHTETQMIVQDFSGINIHKYYPLRSFSSDILDSVLFDVTQRDGGCSVDWSMNPPQIWHPRTRRFVHAWNQPLTDIKGGVTDSTYNEQLNKRVSTLTHYVNRLYHIQAGTQEPRDWCSPECVIAEADWLFDVYDIPIDTDNAVLRYLIDAMTKDILTVTCNRPPTDAEVQQFTALPFADFQTAIRRAVTNPSPN